LRNFLAELKRRNVLRVALAYLASAWLLIQVLETVFPIFDLPPIYIRWTIIGLAILLLPVLALSWAFEWSGSNIRAQEALDRIGDSGSVHRGFDRWVIAVLSVAVVYFAVDKFLLPQIGSDSVGETTVAVLPFADLSDGESAAYLGDGLAEDILSLLSRNPGLQVAARRSSFSFRGSNEPIATIARQLNVSYVLDGSVRIVGERVRINAELVSAHDGYGVWSDAFERGLDELFGVKTAILDAVEATLDVSPSSEAGTAREPDPAAYVLTLRANYLSNDGGAEGMQRAVGLYEQALDVDPDYAAAWVNLAITHANRTIAGHIPFDDGYRLARDAALRAIAVDPESAGGYKTISLIKRYFEGDMPAAIKSMERALELELDNISVLEDAGTLLLNIGQLEEAVRLQEHLVRRSPVDPTSWWNLGLRYRYVDRLDDSIEAFRRSLELYPERSGAHYSVGETHLLAGHNDEALASFQSEGDDAYRLKGQALGSRDRRSSNTRWATRPPLSLRWSA